MEIPPIFIPSKGRWKRKRTTWSLLLHEGIPCTLVVEPLELHAYQQVVEESMRISDQASKIDVVALPLDDQGICYSRNHILLTLAPPSSWFWMIDDDIYSFSAVKRSTREQVNISISKALRIANPRDATNIDPKTCIIGLEYSQFMHRLVPREKFYMKNSYANICVCINRGLFPKTSLDIQYRFPVREDYDLCMQIIAHGGVVFRYQCVGFTAPGMGTTLGGMTAFYENQKDLIRQCNSVMIAFWGDNICTEIVKGKTGGKTPRVRFDLKIHWQRLGKVAQQSLSTGRNYMEVMNQLNAKEALSLLTRPSNCSSSYLYVFNFPQLLSCTFSLSYLFDLVQSTTESRNAENEIIYGDSKD
ncbi:GTP binding protein [Perkinsela sp. CCAP 1560/4]|nr:GTP binding protein [Perkinsela sp. CCAP 1560/4]|eukprot:KNH07284.1 GTP binding protein [Perkinsela sp. CCAP 1560/4]